jgi:3-phosphoshikimate 1-carboxyvinyltransferase
MDVTVYPSSLSGQILIPPSKSIFQRAVACATLAKGTSIIHNPGLSADGESALAMSAQLGADIKDLDESIEITGRARVAANELLAGEAGLGIRLFSAVAATFGHEITVNAEGSLLKRDLGGFEDIYSGLGANVKTNGGKAPVIVHGPWKGGEYILDGSGTSQILTGLLTALPTAENDSKLIVKNLNSTPYVEMTLEVLEKFGIEIYVKDFEEFTIPGRQQMQPCELYVDADWSSAASILCAGAIAGQGLFEIGGLYDEFTQADRAISGILLFAGCKLRNQEGSISLTSHSIRGFEFDATDCPDLFPVLAALATYADKPSKISGVSRLANKESNRALAIQQEFAKAGIKVDLDDDLMTITPGEVKSATLDSHGDHRIAMAASLLALKGQPITITGAECVNKSYPGFFHDLQLLGAKVK